MVYGANYTCMVDAEHVLFVNKDGDNSSWREDGHVGSETLIVGKDESTHCNSSMKNCHFTVLGITAATQDSVCCQGGEDDNGEDEP